MGIQASLTGHLVFSTLHTNNAPSAITRLIDMGVPAYLVASSVVAIMAQRLVRVVCRSASSPTTPAKPPCRRPGSHPKCLNVPTSHGEVVAATVRATGSVADWGSYELMLMSAKVRELTFNEARPSDPPRPHPKECGPLYGTASKRRSRESPPWKRSSLQTAKAINASDFN